MKGKKMEGMESQKMMKEKEMMAKMPTKGMGPGLATMIGLGKKGSKKGK